MTSHVLKLLSEVTLSDPCLKVCHNKLSVEVNNFM